MAWLCLYAFFDNLFLIPTSAPRSGWHPANPTLILEGLAYRGIYSDGPAKFHPSSKIFEILHCFLRTFFADIWAIERYLVWAIFWFFCCCIHGLSITLRALKRPGFYFEPPFGSGCTPLWQPWWRLTKTLALLQRFLFRCNWFKCIGWGNCFFSVVNIC